jgi:deoxyadenosine/deoxycytidine kinase
MVERSIYSVRKIFVEQSRRRGDITPTEMSIFDAWFDKMVACDANTPDLFVYLRAPPSICYDRIRRRSRREERALSLSFLEELHDLHERWLIDDAHLLSAPVVVLDAAYDTVRTKEIFEAHTADILASLKPYGAHSVATSAENTRRPKTLPSRRSFTVSVEGNVGSGKTSLLSYLQDSCADWSIAHEPLDRWANVGGENLLQLMYADPKRWSFSFDACALLSSWTRSRLVGGKCPVHVTERSLYSGRYNFAEHRHRKGYLHDAEAAILAELFDRLERTSRRADLTLYVRASPATCLERIRKRNRAAEKGITLETVAELHDLHEARLLTTSPGPVLVVAAGSDNMEEVYREVRARIARMARTAEL